MDAKTMRAALSAAIRVTVSTSLIGCGGQATSDAGVPETPSSEHAPPVVNERPRYVESSGGSISAGGSSMVASAGMVTVDEGGAAGAPPELSGCEAIDACLKSLASLDFGDPLPDVAAERCCATLIWGISQDSYTRQECEPQLSSDFFGLPAHGTCCAAVNGWGYQACTPWGPPVPPELPQAALEAWRVAA